MSELNDIYQRGNQISHEQGLLDVFNAGIKSTVPRETYVAKIVTPQPVIIAESQPIEQSQQVPPFLEIVNDQTIPESVVTDQQVINPQ